ncbi:MAG TPA: hypothetical protein VFL98_02955 [Candidatus Paceibacterota bacterium]|nr:hypothetical protein [Candidatus Paceibacterota bacterium]
MTARRTKKKSNEQYAVLLKQLGGLIAVTILIAAATAFISATPRHASATGDPALSGYLWSDTIGWISLSCTNTGTCGTHNYGMSMASSGALSGYGWSDSIGWVSANPSDTSVCGSQATVSTSGSVTGWLRAISGGTSQSGGWNGCISLSGSGYGVTFNTANGAFGGYGWGDTNVGWVDFSKASAVASCTPQNICIGNSTYNQNAYCQQTLIKTCAGTCSNGICSEDLPPPTGTLIVAPTLVREGMSTQVSWDSDEAYACQVTGSNGDSWSGTSGTKTSSPITDTVTYTLSCKNDGGSMSVIKKVSVYLVPVYHEI